VRFDMPPESGLRLMDASTGNGPARAPAIRIGPRAKLHSPTARRHASARVAPWALIDQPPFVP